MLDMCWLVWYVRWPLRCMAGACMFSRVVVYALFCMGGLTCAAMCVRGKRQASSVKRLKVDLNVNVKRQASQS